MIEVLGYIALAFVFLLLLPVIFGVLIEVMFLAIELLFFCMQLFFFFIELLFIPLEICFHFVAAFFEMIGGILSIPLDFIIILFKNNKKK